jgi:DNA-binding transcriptional ArsR family regulator
MPVQAGLARIAALLADPAREAILAALADGRALPAGELAGIAGITPQSASGHLRKLVEGGILSVWTQGRFRYFRIANEDIAHAIEALARVAGVPDMRAVPARAAHLREARCCYNHLAGRLGVNLATSLNERGLVRTRGDIVVLTEEGIRWAGSQQLEGYRTAKWNNLRCCLDWSERRFHLAGSLPAALLKMLLETRRFKRGAERALSVTPLGKAWFAQLGIDA